jgi:hypothetical protein
MAYANKATIGDVGMRKTQIVCYQIRSEKIGSFFYADEAEAREEIRKCAEGDNPLVLEFVGKTVQNRNKVIGRMPSDPSRHI